MGSYLHLLAKQVLYFEPNGISKVRLAKILYFTHKGLVQKNLERVDEQYFIRMPLGPVPVGFSDLSTYYDILVKEEEISSLSYNRQVYQLKDYDKPKSHKNLHAVEKIVKQLRPFETSMLVTYSHNEPSWKERQNGEEYILSSADLQLSLPSGKVISITSELDDQRLQAKLVEGMIDDIVDESTSLEYPSQRG